MNCRDFDRILPDLLQPRSRLESISAETGFEAKTRVASSHYEHAGSGPALWNLEETRAHAHSCTRCGTIFAEEIRLSRALGSIASQNEENHGAARIEATLRQAFRASHAVISDLERTGNSGEPLLANKVRQGRAVLGILGRRAAWALAALLLAMIGVTVGERLWLRPQPPIVAQKRIQAPVSNRRNSAESSGRLAATSQASRVANKTLIASRGEFYPLPYGSGLSLKEGWEIVRVEMPVSALEPLGVPVSSGESQHILADVVVADDGTPRAIRFVQ